MTDSLYQQALDYLYSFIDYETMHQPRTAAHFDIRRMQELLARLGSPQLKAKTVHVAGTKGKGSTAAMIASALTAAGYRTGLYTSPHLTDIRERFRIDGKFISEEAIIELTDRLKPEVAAVNRRAAHGELTTFELITALCFLYFAQQRVEFQVVEVGLGGRLDATNVVRPDVCVITTIDLDHTEVLGDTPAQIAAEKAGIIKPGAVVISSPQAEEAGKVIAEACRQNGVELIKVGKDVTWKGLGFEDDRQLIQVEGKLSSYHIASPLLGYYQQPNTATVVAALEALAERGCGITREDIIAGIEGVAWPGRFQVLRKKPLVIADGAHNPAAVRQLKLSLVHYLKGFRLKKGAKLFDKAILVIGASADKDIAGIVSELYLLFNEVIVTRSRHPRAMETEPIAAEFAKYGFKPRVTATLPQALSEALSIAGEKDLVCITGSLFVVGEAVEQLGRG